MLTKDKLEFALYRIANEKFSEWNEEFTSQGYISCDFPNHAQPLQTPWEQSI